MRFDRLIVSDLGAIHEIDLKPHRVNVLIGDNGAGKSTLLDAVRLLLSSESLRYALKKDAPRLIRHGQGRASVIGTVDGKELTLTITHGSGLKIAGQSQVIDDSKGTTEALTFALGGRDFITATLAERARSIDELFARKDIGRELVGAVEAVIGRKLAPADARAIQNGAGDLAKLRASFVEWRREAKRQATAARDRAKPPTIPEGLSTDDEQLVARVMKLLKQERDLQTSIAEVGEQLQLLGHPDLKKSIELARMSVGEDLGAKLKDAQTNLEKLTTKRDDYLSSHLSTSQKHQKALAIALPSLDVEEGCPSCGRAFARDQIAHRKQEAEGKYETVKASHREARAWLKRYEETTVANQAAVDAAAATVSQIATDLAKQQERSREIHQARQDVAAYEALLAGQDHDEAVRVRKEHHDGFVKALEATRKERADVEHQQRSLAEWKTAETQARTYGNTATEADKRSEECDAIEKALAPDKAPARIQSDEWDSFLDALKRIGSTLNLAMDLDRSGRLEVNGHDVRELSTGQTLLARVVHAAAVATVSDVRVLLLDDVNVLDPQNRDRLFQSLDLLIAEGWVDQAFLAFTSDRAELRAPDPESGLLLLSIENGGAREVRDA